MHVISNASRLSIAWAATVLVTGCGSAGSMDLATNEHLYGGSDYEARLPADRALFLPPIVDARSAREELAAGQHAVSYYPDDRWARPPAHMVDDVVRRELTESGVFAELSARPWSNGCTADIELRQFDVGVETHVTGFRSFASLALAVEVRGPLTPRADRPVLVEQQFDETLHSFVGWDPPAASGLMATALERVMSRMLAAIDEAGAGRSRISAGSAGSSR